MAPHPPEDDPKTREAAERHRTRPDPPIQGQTTHRQLTDTDGEGGVGGSLDGLYVLYVKTPGANSRPDTDHESPRLDPAEVLEQQYERAHAELGDASADFTSELAEEAIRTGLGPLEVTESLTSTGVMEENLDLGAELEEDLPSVSGRLVRAAPRRPPPAHHRDRRRPPESAIDR